MMVANSSNLIITVKPSNQKNTLLAPRRGSITRSSQVSAGSNTSEDDKDEIVTFT